jgi:glycine cleavage system H protein
MSEETNIDQLNIPDGLKYTETSEWIKVEGELGRVGVTDYAQHELTDIVYVELPSVGDKVEKGQEFGVVESVKAVAEFYAPVTGKIVEVNDELENAPETMNQDPYGQGWMAVIKITEPSEVDSLMDSSAYREFLKKEKQGH